MYAIDKGGVDSLQNNVGGLKLSTRYGRLHPYADILEALEGWTRYLDVAIRSVALVVSTGIESNLRVFEIRV